LAKRRKSGSVAGVPVRRADEAGSAAAVAVLPDPPRAPETCSACGSSEFHVLFETTDRQGRATSACFEIVECAQCGILRLHPRPSPEELRAWARPSAWPAGTTLADRLERAYRRLVMADEAGFVERAFRHAGVDGPLLDLSPDTAPLRRVLAGRGIRVLAGEPGACGVAPGTCAAAILFDTLGRMADPATALDEARTALQPKGRLVVAFPNSSSWQFLTFGENWSGLDVPRRLIHFRTRDIELLLDCCGFEIVRSKHFTWGRNPADFAASFAAALHPAVRRMRGAAESPAGKLARHILYFMMLAISVPFTAIESACRAGSTVLVEARRKW
jgi:SAM-dependent methyltransferase